MRLVYLVGVKGAEREDPGLQAGDESRAALPVTRFETIHFSTPPSNNILSALREPSNCDMQSAVGPERPEQDNQRLWRSCKSLRGRFGEAGSHALQGGVVHSHHIIYEDALVFVIDTIECGVRHRYVKAICVFLRTLEEFLVASLSCLFQKFSRA